MNDHTKDGQKTGGGEEGRNKRGRQKEKQQEIGEAAQDEAKAHRTS